MSHDGVGSYNAALMPAPMQRLSSLCQHGAVKPIPSCSALWTVCVGGGLGPGGTLLPLLGFELGGGVPRDEEEGSHGMHVAQS